MTYVAIIVVLAIILTKFQITGKLVQYVIYGVGIFLLIMFIQHVSETVDFTLQKTEDMYPRIMRMADDMFNALISFFDHIRK